MRGAHEEHPAYKGDAAKRGNHRARVRYPDLGACQRCGEPAELRHHVDEDTLNNEPENIEFLCRPCHVEHHDPVGQRWASS